jgi:hypothetical protein
VTGKAEIEGLIGSVSSSSLTVNGQVIGVSSDTVIRHGQTRFTMSQLQVGDRVHVKANRMRSSAGSSLQATEIKLQNPQGTGDDDEDDDDTPLSVLVSVGALDANASEVGPDKGTFRFTRTGDLTVALSATFTLTGTATMVADYAAVPLTVSFLAGQATRDVDIVPVPDSLTEGNETVIATVVDGASYDVGSPSTATVTISDVAPVLVTVVALDATAAESPLDTGLFRLSRTGSTAAALTVTFTLTGTATAPGASGADYSTNVAGLSVTFAVGSATADVMIVPIADAVAEGTETVILTVSDGADYDPGAPASATVNIAG